MKKKSSARVAPKPEEATAPKKAAEPKKAAAAKKPAAGNKPRKVAQPPPPPPDSLLERGVHPKLTWLLGRLAPGRYAGGLLQFSLPGTHAAELADWLMGLTEGRTSVGRTAFGELLVFRDLRAHAASLGVADAESACDVSAVDIHFKRMNVLATSAEEFVALLDDREFQKAFLRQPIYADAQARLGDWGVDECFGFVPALALGGREDAASVQRMDWRVHQSLLLQS